MLSTRPNTEMTSVSSPDLWRVLHFVGGDRMSHLEKDWVSLRGMHGAVDIAKVRGVF